MWAKRNRRNKVKLRALQCPASIYRLYHADSDKVTVYQTEAAHEHHNGSTRSIDENVKKVIENLVNNGIKKPKLILRALQSRGINVPTLAQLNNYLVHYRKKKFGANKISLGELEQWCKDNQNIPLDENESFVISYKILYEDEDDEDAEDNDGNKFRIFISSIRLINMASISQHIHADATYKLVWQGFPVLVIGTTDFNKAFHPFGLAICSYEKQKILNLSSIVFKLVCKKFNKTSLEPTALISDGADSIKNGFKNVFNNSYNQIMCWAHMKTKVENRICQVDDKNIRKEIIDDIELLQLCNATAAFELASTLFMKKWNMNMKQKTKQF
ncbi:unnamed protein product [Rotaria sp. Silwood1]|nr:unnamed protein product [Rotaria sp. Silwood1]